VLRYSYQIEELIYCHGEELSKEDLEVRVKNSEQDEKLLEW
jgi:hypothetical protein